MDVIKKIWNKISYEVLLYSYFVFEMILRLPSVSEMTEWRTTLYAVTYACGFIERAFMGSVFALFTKRLTAEILYYTLLAALVVLAGFVCKVLGRIIREGTDACKNVLMVLVLLYIASPVSVTRFYFARNFASFDTFLMFITFVCAFIIDKPKIRWAVPVLCLIAMAIHHVYAFTYYMFIFGMLLYDWYRKKFRPKDGILFASTFISSVLAFLYFQFIGNRVQFSSPDEMLAYLRSGTDIPLQREILRRYFTDAKTYFMEWCWYGESSEFGKIGINMKERAFALLLVLIVCIPFILLFVSLWKKTVQACENKIGKWVYRFFLFAPLFAIPIFIFAVDWDRWMMGILTVQFLFIYALLKNGDGNLRTALLILEQKVRKYKLPLLAYALVLALLKYVRPAYNLNPAAQHIVEYIETLF